MGSDCKIKLKVGPSANPLKTGRASEAAAFDAFGKTLNQLRSLRHVDAVNQRTFLDIY